MLNIVATYPSKNFCELKILNIEKSKLTPKELESFFISWRKRIPLKPLILIITENYINNGLDTDTNEENIKIIERYKKLGIIKEFKIEAQFTEKFLFE